MLKDAASSAKPKKYAQNNRHGIYEGTMGMRNPSGREMQGAEDRQGGGETQIAQGYDLVEAAGLRDIGLRGPQRNQEKQDAGAAHRNHRARDLKKCGENGCVHVDARRKLACSIREALSRDQYSAKNCTTRSRRRYLFVTGLLSRMRNARVSLFVLHFLAGARLSRESGILGQADRSSNLDLECMTSDNCNERDRQTTPS